MVAEPRIYVDVEAAVRAWAREEMTSLSGRVFFGFPEKYTYPLITLQRVSGTDDDCLIQFDVWAATKAAAATTAAELATAADALGRYVYGSTLLLGARVENPGRWLPDEQSDTPRYLVEVAFMAFSTQGVG